MPFNHRDLQLLIKIAEHRSLTRGAKSVHMSLAAASLRIKKIESNLGLQLLYRNSNGVEFTSAGSVLLRHAWRSVAQLEELKAELGPYQDGLQTHVRVLANTTAVTEFMPRMLSRYLSQYPSVSVTLEEHLTDQIVHAIADGAADLGIVAGIKEIRGLQVIHFSTDQLVVVTPPGHPLAQHDEVRFLDTLDYPQIGLYNSSTLQVFLTRILTEEVRRLHMRVQVRGFDVMCNMIAHNVGIGIMPLSVAQHYQKTLDIVCVALSDPWAVRERGLVVNDMASLSAPAQALAEMILENKPLQ